MKIDTEILWLLGGIVSFLFLASAITAWLIARSGGQASPVIKNLAARVRAWWVMVAVFSAAVLTGGAGSVLLFALISFLALREYITLTPTRRGDHATLFWAFFAFIPANYLLIWLGWYGLYAILIPVYAFILLPIRSAAGGDCERYLERTAKVQWGLMACVYFLSHAPALLMLEIAGYPGENAKLLLFLVLVVQISDVMQYVWGKLLGRHQIAPTLSPNKTIEGFVGGVLSASALGAALWWTTPFEPWQAAVFALLITLLGFFGGLVMSAIKRDRGIKDFGTLIEGHGGIMDRIDSLCFAAPLFFHLVRFYFT